MDAETNEGILHGDHHHISPRLIEREEHGYAVQVSVCPHLDFLSALDPTFDGEPEPREDPDTAQYAVAVSPMTYSC